MQPIRRLRVPFLVSMSQGPVSFPKGFSLRAGYSSACRLCERLIVVRFVLGGAEVTVLT
jgi:hypothetical protein